jgi:hypothetical protein
VADPGSLPTLESIAHRAACQFGHVFGEQVSAIESLSALRANAQSKTAAELDPPAPEFPAEDTPLQIPLRSIASAAPKNRRSPLEPASPADPTAAAGRIQRFIIRQEPDAPRKDK